ncbi:MAG TPA: M15 family metallopeptidase [Actinomycetota bacterium]|nr:M15 family metallopeptidase [Actinomycetota bacterium]
MSIRRTAGLAAGIVIGFALGASATLSIQGRASLPAADVRTRAADVPHTEPQPPDAFLVWTSGGMPEGFRPDLRHLDGIRRSVVIASDNAWLDKSWSAQGEVIDDPRPGYAIPLEVAAVDPREFAPFLPPADRSVALALADGQGILGESSARLRGLGPGAEMRFGDVRIEVAAILPDELVGANELMVSREVGRSIGVTRDRYALVVPESARTGRGVQRLLDPILPSDPPSKVRAPGDTPYFRQGDAVLPPVRIKLLFGEFAARPTPGRPGYLTLDPAWVRRNIDTQRVPLLGSVTCNVALFPQIRGVVHELIERGLQDTIQSFSGCFSARHINSIPTAGLSHHSWGIALDLNVRQGNLFGQTPHQDPRLVRVFERWGFVWGGTFIVPDGMHFEYHREPAEG